MRWELFQFHLRGSGIPVFVVRANNKIPERIRSDGDSFPGRGRKVQSGAGAGRDGGFQARTQGSHGRDGRGVNNKMSSSRLRQSAASLAERELAGYEFGPAKPQVLGVRAAPGRKQLR